MADSSLLLAQKQANSAVPLSDPRDPRIQRLKVPSLPERVAAGDYAAALQLIRHLVQSGETLCGLVEALPAIDEATPEGRVLAAAKAEQLPKLREVYTGLRSLLEEP